MMFLYNVKNLSLPLIIMTTIGLSGCSYLKEELDLFDEPEDTSSIEEYRHYDASADKSAAKEENEVEVNTTDAGGTGVSAGPVVKGLVADIKQRAYDEKNSLKEPVVMSDLEEETSEDTEIKLIANDEPPAPKAMPVVEVAEEDIKEDVVAQNVEEKTEELIVASDDNAFVEETTVETDDNVVRNEDAIETVASEAIEKTVVKRSNDSEDFPGLLPLPDDEFEIEMTDDYDFAEGDIFTAPQAYVAASYKNEVIKEAQDDIFTTAKNDFNFIYDSSNLGSFETVIVDDEIGTKPLSNYDIDNSLISYLATVVYHDHGRSDVDAKNMKEIINVAKTYKKKPCFIRIVGHASSRTANLDPVKHMMANFVMSLERARNVAKALIDYGVKASDIYVGAVSDSEPIYYEVMPAGEAKNRRTEIYIEFP